MRGFKTAAALAFASLMVLGLGHPALTQSAASSDFAAAISPLPILLQAKPGSTVSSDLLVNNPSAHDEKLKVVVKTFTQDGSNGTINLHDPTPADSFISWISFSKTEFDAPPGLWQTVHMTVNIPSTAAFGYYFAVEFTQANAPAGQANSTGAAIQGAVASFVLLNAQAPGETKQLQVTSFSANHRFYEFLPVDFTIKVHNSGNIFAGASGNIFIKRGSKTAANLTVNSNHGLVLPGSNRLFYDSWDSGFPVYQTVFGSGGQPLEDKNGNLKTKLSWNFGQISKLRFGHYTADLALVYNNGTRDVPITGSVSFWVIPWRLIGIVIFILALIAGLITYVIILRRRLKRARHINKGGSA
ncbi:MAG: hypothetical protein ACREGG_03105 [Candidatus Saccharimonadales bacterium]